MQVIVSIGNDKRHRVYHKFGCIYEKRIKNRNRMQMDSEQAIKRHYKECKYCAGLAGDVKVHKDRFARLSVNNDADITYQKNTGTMYIQTGVGFWKVYEQATTGNYLLFHRNSYNPNMSYVAATHGDYHRQAEVKQTDSIDRIVNYVVKHDKAKKIILDDYRKLPQRTRKQKMYYKVAERKAKRKEMQRLDYLFAAIAQA